MKPSLRAVKTIVSLLALLVMLAAGAAPRAEPSRYEIDPDHLSITFKASHLGLADTRGMFLKGHGSFTFDESVPKVSDIRFTVEAASVFTNHKARDEHLRSPDFLDAEVHPEITFVGKSSRQTGPQTGTVTGDLTLRGVTRPVTLYVTWIDSRDYPFGTRHHAIGLSVEANLQRSEFGSTYGVENGWVGDDIALKIDFEAKRVGG